MCTNKTGRFGAEGLAPGRWIIEVSHHKGPVRYELNVPKARRMDFCVPASCTQRTGT